MKVSGRSLPQAAATAAAVIFGFSFLFTKDALDYLNTFQLMGLRFFTAALVLSLLKITGIIKVNIRLSTIKALLVVAFFQPVLYFICETMGVDLTSASESGIIISLVPIAITVFAVILLKERLSLFQWVSVFVSVAGVILIIIPKSSADGGKNLVGVLFLLGAVLSAGLYNVYSRKVSSSYTPAEITFVMMWVGAIIFNFIGIIDAVMHGNLRGFISALANPHVLADISYLGILSSIGAFFLLNYSLSKIEASKTAVFMNITPVVSVLAGIFIRGERFYMLQCMGAAIVLLGLWGVNSRSAGKNRLKVGLFNGNQFK
jgi:drug/metabolite transporter (DMT)-like permease